MRVFSSCSLNRCCKFRLLYQRFTHSSAKNKTLNIGDVSVELFSPKRPELVPKGYVPSQLSNWSLHHLRWMLQKQKLGQDMFMIGPPGCSKRQLVMQFLEVTEREYEYLSLSRDTTDADIKQRREIQQGSAFYSDLCAVRAALNGRVLVLDGIEKAERNVLPILNNLLENREVQLDDGRFLMHHSKFDKLLEEHSPEEIKSWQLERVSENFMVIALGLPVPKFRGHPLDPPLRSRFQSRLVNALPFRDNVEILEQLAPKVDKEKLNSLVSLAYALNSEESSATSAGLPHFPIDNIQLLARIWNLIPEAEASEIINFAYPSKLMLKTENYEAFVNAEKAFDIKPQKNASLSLKNVENNEFNTGKKISVLGKKVDSQFEVPSGSHSNSVPTGSSTKYVANTEHDNVFIKMLLAHSVNDFCVVGPKGCGKSVLVNKFAETLGYDAVHVALFQDMTSRDLLQTRGMSVSGDTYWTQSPLVQAAKQGKLAVLDGLHRVHHSILNALQRLVHEREIELFDGTRLMDQNVHDQIMKENNYTNEDMQQRGIHPIHPSFRIVALAESPNVLDSSRNWMIPELLSLFLFVQMPSLSHKAQTQLVQTLLGAKLTGKHQSLLKLTEKIESSQDNNLKSLADSFSTRQLLRMCRRLLAYPDEDLYSTVHRACLAKFLPSLTRESLDSVMEACGIKADQAMDHEFRPRECVVDGNQLKIGTTVAPINQTANKSMVPDIVFYNNPQHMALLEDMLRDFMLGEHLLLIGNQGVGKNKLADKILQLLNRPRQYIQLHRDTTVQTLTLQATVTEGKLLYEDSALVKAVKDGDILVIDEGDKAPTHVTCIIKSLIESGYMHLADGRRIVPHTFPELDTLIDPKIIRMHPDFRVIVLANRPGFPFLGNDFFAAMGDVFSCHVIDNPSQDSELAMLKMYAPGVQEDLLKKLVGAFSELRNLADQDLINYPYSTRELVNIVRHIQDNPKDSLASVVANVFDFDTYSSSVRETLARVMSRHAIPIAPVSEAEVSLRKPHPLPPLVKCGDWGIGPTSSGPIPVQHTSRPINWKGTKDLIRETFPLERCDMRSKLFTEQTAHWQLPISDVNMVSSVTSRGMDYIYLSTVNPVGVYMMNLPRATGYGVSLAHLFPTSKGYFKPRTTVLPLSTNVFQDTLLLHEELSNTVLLLDLKDNKMFLYDVGIFKALSDALNRIITTPDEKNFFRLAPSVDNASVFLYEKGGTVVNRIDFSNHNELVVDLFNTIKAPISSVNAVSNEQVLVETRPFDGNKKSYYLLNFDPANPTVEPVDCSVDFAQLVLSSELMPEAMAGALVQGPRARLMTDPRSYAAVSADSADFKCPSPIYSCERPEGESFMNVSPFWASSGHSKLANAAVQTAFMNSMGQVVRALPVWKVPKKVVQRDTIVDQCSGFLEVTDLVNKSLKYIPVPSPKWTPIDTNWMASLMQSQFVLSPYGTEGVVTADTSGGVRTWETVNASLETSLSSWKRQMGFDQESGPLEAWKEKEDGSLDKLTGPKHGMVDPTGAAHVGGGMWAGGSGGFNTAGLGGVGGPYRLDSGNQVFQASDHLKDQVPEHIKEKAREMNRRAFRQRLNEIKMSEHDANSYLKFKAKVEKEIERIRVTIDSLQAKGKERLWVRHQTSGDVDEGKIIEGLTGEKSVYRRRTDQDPEPGTPQQKPKRLRLCVDVSGSMYRFNGYDGRLQRSLEATLMLMEALNGYEQKFKYDIVGHSGEEACIPFVSADAPPKNEKVRFDTIKQMIAHAQFCWSGDNTLECLVKSIADLSNEQDCDEYFVLLLSDANLERYGIKPKDMAMVMNKDSKVNVFSIFIGSLGEQAERLRRHLPAGRAFVCTDTDQLPHIINNIFTSTLLGTNNDD